MQSCLCQETSELIDWESKPNIFVRKQTLSPDHANTEQVNSPCIYLGLTNLLPLACFATFATCLTRTTLRTARYNREVRRRLTTAGSSGTTEEKYDPIARHAKVGTKW